MLFYIQRSKLYVERLVRTRTLNDQLFGSGSSPDYTKSEPAEQAIVTVEI